jgi:hypothetical protein
VNSVSQACTDRHEYEYKRRADALKAGEVDRGWIPDYLPESAFDIHLAYDPSSPRTWCAFKFSPTDSQAFRKNLKELNGPPPPQLARIGDPGFSWWPSFLRGDVDFVLIRERGLRAYTAEERDAPSTTDLIVFLIAWDDGRAFFYRTPRS